MIEMEQSEPIAIVEYDPAWPALFMELRDRIAAALGPLALSIEHVGSTAVPGLAAKPVIDLDAVVRAAEVPAAISALERIGYRHEGDLGVEGREAFHQPPDAPRHHLYVCAEGNPALSNHLSFRDCLRANPAIAREYAALKMELASRYRHDRARYTEAKSAFIQSVLRRGA
jgi:GrpB-like predicted nucleotidyltransferase (UPF0157 family)